MSLLQGGGVDKRRMEGISITPSVLAGTMTMVMRMIMAGKISMIITIARIKGMVMNHR